jgi:hypothetical protein
MRIRFVALIVLAAVCALSAPSAASPGVTSADWLGWKFLGTTCHTNSSGLIFARVKVRMLVNNSGIGSHWASNMRVRARLIPPGSGLNISRSWRTQRAPTSGELLQDHRYFHNFAVDTDVMSPNADWRVQVKLIWDRKVPFHDVVKGYTFPFRTGNCAGADNGDAVTLG